MNRTEHILFHAGGLALAGGTVSANRFLTGLQINDSNSHYEVMDIASLMQSARFLNIALEPAL